MKQKHVNAELESTGRWYLQEGRAIPEGSVRNHLLEVLSDRLGYPDEPETDQLAGKPSKTFLRVGLVIGHNEKSQGAYAKNPVGMSEFSYHRKVFARVSEIINDNDLPIEEKIFERTKHRTYGAEIRECYARVMAFKPDITVEGHFDWVKGSSGGRKGTAMVHSGSAKSEALAKVFQKSMVASLGTHDRGLIQRGPKSRGGLSVHVAPVPSILTEPWDSEEEGDRKIAAEIGIDGMARSYVDALLAYREEVFLKQA